MPGTARRHEVIKMAALKMEKVVTTARMAFSVPHP